MRLWIVYFKVLFSPMSVLGSCRTLVLTQSEQTKTVLSHPSLINNYFTSHILGSSPNQGLFAASVGVHGGEWR